MRTPLTWIEKTVGLFVVLILALLATALFFTARRHSMFQLRKPFEIFTFLDTGRGLKTGAPVKINEVEAGVVTAVEIVPEGKRDPKHFDKMVRVTIRVESEYPQFLSRKTRAIVKPPVPAVEPAHIVLESDPRDRASGRLDAGAVIDAEVEPSIFEKLAGIKEDVAAVKDDVLKTLRDIQGIIANVKESTDAIATGRGAIGRAIHDTALGDDVASSVATLRAALEELRALAANARTASEPVTATAQDARALVADVRAAVAKVDRAVEPLPGVIASAERALRDVEVMVRNLREASGGIPEIVRKADRGLEETNRTIEAAQKSFLLRGNLPPRPAAASEAEALPRAGGR